MPKDATSAAPGCIFCAIVAREAEARVVFEDEIVVAFMDLNPVTPGHLLVVPREHAVGLEDLDGATSAHVWSISHDMSRALRRSRMRCEGINILLCDGEVAFQTVFHFHPSRHPSLPRRRLDHRSRLDGTGEVAPRQRRARDQRRHRVDGLTGDPLMP